MDGIPHDSYPFISQDIPQPRTAQMTPKVKFRPIVLENLSRKKALDDAWWALLIVAWLCLRFYGIVLKAEPWLWKCFKVYKSIIE